MREERFEVGEVPGRLYLPPGADALLLIGHGGGYGKDSPRFERLARRYADETGLAVVCIDAVNHGERRSTAATREVPPGWHSRTIDQMVTDWQATVAALDSIGSAVAYVGFSMGAIFGFSTVAVIGSIQAAVFVAGGIPEGGGINDPELGPLVLKAASSVANTRVLMLNKADDEIFPVDGVHATFDAVPGTTKELLFWDGDHNDWPPDLIDRSISFIQECAT